MVWRWLVGAALFVAGIVALLFAWAIVASVLLVIALLVYLFGGRARGKATIIVKRNGETVFEERRGHTIEGEATRVDEPPARVTDKSPKP